MDTEGAARRAAATKRRVCDEKARKRAVLSRLLTEARPMLAARGEVGQLGVYPITFEPPADG